MGQAYIRAWEMALALALRMALARLSDLMHINESIVNHIY